MLGNIYKYGCDRDLEFINDENCIENCLEGETWKDNTKTCEPSHDALKVIINQRDQLLKEKSEAL